MSVIWTEYKLIIHNLRCGTGGTEIWHPDAPHTLLLTKISSLGAMFNAGVSNVWIEFQETTVG